MRRVSIGNVEAGSSLGRTLYNDRGDALLRKGAALTARYIEVLREKGFTYVFIEDPDTDDIIAEDIVSEHVRLNANRTVFRFLDVVDRAAKQVKVETRLDSPVRLRLAMQSDDFKKAAFDSSIYEQLYQVIENIIAEVIDAPILSGLTAIKSHDNYTFCHSVDVAITAIVVGKKLFFDHLSLRQLALGCMLHDAGKIFVDPAILNKPGSLTTNEFEQMKKHPGLGYQLLRSLQPDEILANHVAYQHHERQDGNGYPRGLQGTNRISRIGRPSEAQITLIAEIAAVADVYDALTADRPYRKALLPDKIVEIVRGMAGPSLNQEIVGHFLSILPVYPLGIEVVIKNGRYRSWRGIVTRIHEKQMDRPIIRLLFNDQNRRVAGPEIDLAKETDIAVAAILV